MARITLKDVAKAAGVSETTVSLVLNKKNHRISDETVLRVEKTAKELNYTPNRIARSLATKTSAVIALIFPDIVNPYFPSLAKRITQEALSHDYGTMLINYDCKYDKEPLSILQSGAVDGALLVTRDYGLFESQVPAIKNIPVVLLEPSNNMRPNSSVISSDFYAGAFEATSWLLSNGHSSIACLTGPQDILVAKLRLDGMLDAMKCFGLKMPSKNIIPSEFSMEAGYSAADVVKKLKVTAVVCNSVFAAFGLIKGLNEKGIRVPEDVSIFGYDDLTMGAFTTPSLSTVGLHTDSVSTLATRHLIDLITDPETEPLQTFLQPKVILRGSTSKRIFKN